MQKKRSSKRNQLPGLNSLSRFGIKKLSINGSENNPLRPNSTRAFQNKIRTQIRRKRNKQKMEDKLIEMTINKIQNENAYEYLIKMGEANEICQKLGMNITYRVFNSADGSIKCHIYELNHFKKCLNLDDFNRE